MQKLTDEEYRELKAKNDRLEAWVDTLRKRTKCGKCKGTGKARSWMAASMQADNTCQKCMGRGYRLGWATYKPEERPADILDVTNDERSQIEVYEFVRDCPRKYTAYVKHDSDSGRPIKVTTWMGEELGKVTWSGQKYKMHGFGPWPQERQNLRIVAINGLVYSAVCFAGSDTYCHMKAFKTAPMAHERQILR